MPRTRSCRRDPNRPSNSPFGATGIVEVSGPADPSRLRTLRRAAGLAGLLSISLLLGPARADWFSPGTGSTYTLDDLVSLSGGAVTGSAPGYEIHDSIVISTTDALSVAAGSRIDFVDTAGVLRLEIRGSLLAHGAPADSILFTSPTGGYGDYAGIDFRDTGPGSVFEMSYCIVEYADIAIDVVSADAQIESSVIRRSANKAIDLTGSDGVVRNCVLRDNYRQTIYMTLSSSPLIENNLITGNNIENSSPYPFINIGLQGVNSPTIRGNTILGGNFMSGGISIWNECHGVIESNHIEGCGYGLLCYQFDADPLITGNTFVDNNIHPDTVNWGFGVACNGENAPTLTLNSFQGHNYGVALINGAQPNLGDLGNADPDDDGGNQFLGNGLGEDQYELYNNTSLDILAEGNWWGTADPAEIEDRIVHSVDDPLLGTVDFDPFLTALAVGEPSGAGSILELQLPSPNPSSGSTVVRFALEREADVRFDVYDPRGRRVRNIWGGSLPSGAHALSWSGLDDRGEPVPVGVYFWRLRTGSASASGRIVRVR